MVENFPNLDRFLECIRVPVNIPVNPVDDFENESKDMDASPIQDKDDQGAFLRQREVKQNKADGMPLKADRMQRVYEALPWTWWVFISCVVLSVVLRLVLKRIRFAAKNDRKAL